MQQRPFRTEMLDDGRTLAVSGAVDENAAEDFRRALHQCLQQNDDPVVDLSDVDFLPSFAVGVLVSALERNPTLVVTARDGTIAAKVLKICGIHFEQPEAKP